MVLIMNYTDSLESSIICSSNSRFQKGRDFGDNRSDNRHYLKIEKYFLAALANMYLLKSLFVDQHHEIHSTEEFYRIISL